MNKYNDDYNFLYNFLIHDKDFKNEFAKHNLKVSYKNTIKELLDYVLNSEFNPYLDKEYLDITWLRDNSTNTIYNLDDIFEVYCNNLQELEREIPLF